MKRLLPRLALPLAASLLLPLSAHAQAFRTYLASYGNDSNPGCTVSAPCRLLPAALNAVLDGGEIWILDSANFNAGTVNINKSVSIMAVPGQIASIVAAGGGPAITIATPNVTVALRNIVIPKNANNPGTNGIDMSQGASLAVEDCLFANLAAAALYVHDTAAIVQVKGSLFRNVSGYAVYASNGPTVNIAGSQMLNVEGGVLAISPSPVTTSVSVSDSIISNAAEGVWAYTTLAGAVARIYVTRTTLHNTTRSLDSGTDGNGSATVYAGGNMIDGGNYGWYVLGPGASIVTHGNNQFSGVTANVGTMTSDSLQ